MSPVGGVPPADGAPGWGVGEAAAPGCGVAVAAGMVAVAEGSGVAVAGGGVRVLRFSYRMLVSPAWVVTVTWGPGPPDGTSGRDPTSWICSAELNSACAKVFAPAKTLDN